MLSHYQSENPGVLKHLTELLSWGRLGGSGKLLIYAIDQGFELGPDLGFSANPEALDPAYHFELAVQGKLSAIAAPAGFLQACVHDFAGKIPMILKMNSNNRLMDQTAVAPYQSLTSSVDEALRLGCIGVGLTIYPGSDDSYVMYEEIAEIAAEAKARGLFVMIWSYPRAQHLDGAKALALDVVAYATHIACLLGAHIIKVKIPDNTTVLVDASIYPNMSLQNRIQHIVKSAFNGKRFVLFSGGEKKEESLFLTDMHAIMAAGAHGSVVGRNLFQRPKTQALSLIEHIVNIYTTH